MSSDSAETDQSAADLYRKEPSPDVQAIKPTSSITSIGLKSKFQPALAKQFPLAEPSSFVDPHPAPVPSGHCFNIALKAGTTS